LLLERIRSKYYHLKETDAVLVWGRSREKLMTTCAIFVPFMAAILFGQAAPEVAGQPAQKDAQKEAIKKEGPIGDRRERGARGDRIANASPEDRQRFQVDRLVDRATRTYELSDDQKVTVRHEIEKMERERREAMGLEAAEYDKLQERMLKLRRPIRGRRRVG
jgi:hypothetical protein